MPWHGGTGWNGALENHFHELRLVLESFLNSTYPLDWSALHFRFAHLNVVRMGDNRVHLHCLLISLDCQ